jgi:hypothetical protein
MGMFIHHLIFSHIKHQTTNIIYSVLYNAQYLCMSKALHVHIHVQYEYTTTVICNLQWNYVTKTTEMGIKNIRFAMKNSNKQRFSGCC